MTRFLTLEAILDLSPFELRFEKKITSLFFKVFP
jgi:hypothetical protein